MPGDDQDRRKDGRRTTVRLTNVESGKEQPALRKIFEVKVDPHREESGRRSREH